ncbi:MAG TPA: flagellin [Atribacteraceae bacterium]|nr:flagellin [Atribacteraceae bacterium]
MGLRINQNMMALNAHRNLVSTNKALSRSLERLSSGLRINRAADDAAGLAISEKMRAQVQGLGQAMRNAEDGISLIQTAEGALNEVHSILQRMRVLSVQAANDTLTSSDRVEIQKEINQLRVEIDRIGNTTEFNTKQLLDGTTAALASTDRLSTVVFMRDGMRVIDQFGQKAVGGGNYRIDIQATPGAAQVMMTDIMRVMHAENVRNVPGTGANVSMVQRFNVVGAAGAAISEINIELTAATATTTATTVTWSAAGTITVQLARDAAGAVTATTQDVYNALAATAANVSVQSPTGAGPVDMAFNEVFNFRLGDGTVVAQEGLTTVANQIGSFVGDVANFSSELRNIDRFWDASGNFLLQNPQTITLIQGNGREASITLFSSDTVQSVIDKLNVAIGVGLEQNQDIGTARVTNYVSYVSPHQTAAITDQGFMSVPGNFVIQTAVTGNDGELNFLGDEDLIKALSLTTVQQSRENTFSIDVFDAHDPTRIVASNVEISGNRLIGLVHSSVDVEFASNSGLSVAWSAASSSWVFTGGTANQTTTFVHLADNTQVFQIGANPLQDVGAAIGDMRARSLGVHNVLVTTRDLANRAISQVDQAVARVSGERSKLGALQNRLEHTISNLGVSSENLAAAEARIRDVDMAEEMMAFTRAQILLQAGTAMLAQANTIPQTVLQLLR